MGTASFAFSALTAYETKVRVAASFDTGRSAVWQRARFGTVRSEVRILSPRLLFPIFIAYPLRHKHRSTYRA